MLETCFLMKGLYIKLLPQIAKTWFRKTGLRRKRNLSSFPTKNDHVKRGALNLMTEGRTLSLPSAIPSFKKIFAAKKVICCSLFYLFGS